MSFNMFSSINFLFLISLAITSWILLCYFKHIESNLSPEINIDFNIDQAMDETLKMSPISCRLSENYDLYLNFLCIFACVYALAKVTEMTESFIAKQVSDRFGKIDDANLAAGTENNADDHNTKSTKVGATVPATASKICTPINNNNKNNSHECKSINNASHGSGVYSNKITVTNATTKTAPIIETTTVGTTMPIMTTVDAYEKTTEYLMAKNQELHLEITNLKKRNAELEQRLNDALLEKPNYIMVGNGGGNREMDVKKYEDKANSVLGLQLQNKNPSTSSVFAPNHHFNLNRQVFVNEGNVKLNFQTINKEGGDFSQVWQKYLEMPKYASKISAAVDPSDEKAGTFPVVISTEELDAEGPF